MGFAVELGQILTHNMKGDRTMLKRTALYRACQNNYGFFDASVGTDLSRRLCASPSTIRDYIKRGWLKPVGSGLVLTKKGYHEC